jgi:hypothetical protein
MIRHYRIFAGARTGCIATVRKLLGMPPPAVSADNDPFMIPTR